MVDGILFDKLAEIGTALKKRASKSSSASSRPFGGIQVCPDFFYSSIFSQIQILKLCSLFHPFSSSLLAISSNYLQSRKVSLLHSRSKPTLGKRPSMKLSISLKFSVKRVLVRRISLSQSDTSLLDGGRVEQNSSTCSTRCVSVNSLLNLS